MKFTKAITPLFRRVIAFLGIFVVMSGAAGPRIIESDILFRDGFGAYGTLGKVFVFGAIAFALLARRKKAIITLKAWQRDLIGWFALALVAFGLSWTGVDGLIAGERNWQNLALAHGGLLLSLLCAALGCVGPANVARVWQGYRRELTIAAIITVLFYAFLLAVYALWQPLASVVMVSVHGLLAVSGLEASVFPPHTLVLDKFGITIAEYCSGVESIALFTGLYVIVGVLDWPRLNWKLFFIIFPIALALLCILNIVRVYGLIVAGYYINPDIAFSLFHTYAGLVFFILYSAAFWAVAYRYIVKKS